MLGDSHLTTSAIVCSNSLTNRRVVSECVEYGTEKASSNVPDHSIEHERAMMKTGVPVRSNRTRLEGWNAN